MRTFRHLVVPVLAVALMACKTNGASDDTDDTDASTDTTDEGTDDTDDTTDDDTTDDEDDTDDGTPQLYDESCDDPLEVGTLCVTIEDYGTRKFTLTKLQAAQAVASTVDDADDDRDALIIQHVQFQEDDIPAATTQCNGAITFIQFRLSAAPADDIVFTTQGEGGGCEFVVTTGGAWASQPIIGTFTGTVVEDEGTETRTISGSFSYDKGAE